MKSEPTWNQASKIIARFPSIAVLAKTMGVHESTVYRWTYPHCSDGLVPISAIPLVLGAAKRLNVTLQPTDWVPE